MKRFKAFSLIEVISVIIVIIILATLVLPRIGNMRQTATNARDMQNVATVQEALERAVTEGRITPSNAGNAYYVLATGTNLANMPYMTEMPTNLVIIPTNWPGFIVYIATNAADTNLLGGGGINQTNAPGNTNNPAQGMIAPVLSGSYPDQATWTYSGAIQPVYWVVLQESASGGIIDAGIADWQSLLGTYPMIGTPDGGTYGITYADTTPIFVFGVDSNGNRVTLNSNPFVPANQTPPLQNHASDYMYPITQAIGSANNLLAGYNGYPVFWTPYQGSTPGTKHMAVLSQDTSNPQGIIDWANANAKPQYAHAIMPPADLYTITMEIRPNWWYYDYSADFVDPNVGIGDMSVPAYYRNDPFGTVYTPTDLIIIITFLPTGDAYEFDMSTSNG